MAVALFFLVAALFVARPAHAQYVFTDWNLMNLDGGAALVSHNWGEDVGIKEGFVCSNGSKNIRIWQFSYENWTPLMSSIIKTAIYTPGCKEICKKMHVFDPDTDFPNAAYESTLDWKRAAKFVRTHVDDAASSGEATTEIEKQKKLNKNRLLLGMFLERCGLP